MVKQVKNTKRDFKLNGKKMLIKSYLLIIQNY